MLETDDNQIHLLAIAGTGTDVGKTVATASLLRNFRLAGLSAQAIKPLQTGVDPGYENISSESDSAIYCQAVADLPDITVIAPAATLMTFPMPASPHLAASDFGTKIDLASIAEKIHDHVARLKRGNNKDTIIILECAGGLLVPLNRHEFMIDLLAMLAVPVILVGNNCLGCLNHFLLSMEALSSRGLKLAGIVMHNLPGQDIRIQKDNLDFLTGKIQSEKQEKFLPTVPVIEMPHLNLTDHGSWQILAERMKPFTSLVQTVFDIDASADYIDRDHKSVWHPYSSTTNLPRLELACRSHKNKIVLANGNELIDGMSSWWSAIHGYNHPELLAAMHNQSVQMPHVMFGGLTHIPAISLAERLLTKMPAGLERIFFADSGSVAVEVAMKMALQYQMGIGEKQRNKFLTVRGGYHGDTIGAMSVCDPDTGMHSLFTGILAKQLFLPRPECRFGTKFELSDLDSAIGMLDRHGENIAAMIMEPIVQGAGGMWFYHQDYLKGLKKLCEQKGILLIFDEIATGFGRTGKFFAAEWAGICPDILCCGKALTGGLLTLAATACTGKVAEGICKGGQAFMHGPTFMANALACAVACASLDIMDKNQWQGQVADLESWLKTGLEPCRNLKGVRDVRILGGIGVVEMSNPVKLDKMQAFFVKHGVWIRPFGHLIYLMPPYITPQEDIIRLCEVVKESVGFSASSLNES